MLARILSKLWQHFEGIEKDQYSRLAWVVDHHKRYDRGDTFVPHENNASRKQECDLPNGCDVLRRTSSARCDFVGTFRAGDRFARRPGPVLMLSLQPRRASTFSHLRANPPRVTVTTTPPSPAHHDGVRLIRDFCQGLS